MAKPGLGANAWLGFAEESAWGTWLASTGFYKLAAGETLRLNRNYFNDPSLGGASIEDIFPGTEAAGGDIPLPVRYEGLEKLFKHLIGSVATVDNTDGSYTHTFSPADTLPGSLSLEVYRDMPSTKSFQYAGCLLTKAVFRIERDNPLMLGLTAFGQGEEMDTKGTPSYPSATLCIPSQLTVSKTGFSGAVDVLSGQLELNNPVEEDRFDLAVGGVLKEPQRSDKRSVLGTIEGEFSEEAQYTDFADGTPGMLTYKWEGATISAGPSKYTLQIDVYCKMTSRPPTVSSAGSVKMTTGFQGFKDGTDLDFKLTLTNTIVSV